MELVNYNCNKNTLFCDFL